MTVERVVFYTKPGCHLCETAEAIVTEVCARLKVGWTSINILDDPELIEKFGEQIPVTFVDGKQHDFWRVDPVRLHTALTR